MWQSYRQAAFNWSLAGVYSQGKKKLLSFQQSEVIEKESYANNYEPKLKVVINQS